MKASDEIAVLPVGSEQLPDVPEALPWGLAAILSGVNGEDGAEDP